MISKKCSDIIKEYMLSQYPNEGCGFILKDDSFLPCPNIAKDTQADFEIADRIFLEYEDNIKAIVHSHPDGKDAPSKSDMQAQISVNIPYGVCVTRDGWVSEPWFWGDSLGYEPLIGREFRHGPYGTDKKGDCFALIRDYYKSISILIPDYPRDDEWWVNGEDMYDSFFRDAGFRDVTKKERREHDVFMMKINSKVINHAGIYIGNGLLLHHLYNRLSRREPTARWPKMIVKWVRHNELM